MYRVLYITVVFIQLIIVAIVASSNNGITTPLPPPQCTYQDAPLKETTCTKLIESKPYTISIKKNEHKHYHFRIEDLALINHLAPTIHVRASPCSGGVFMWAKTNPFPWPNEFDYRYEANNTEPGSIKQIDTRMYNRDYYITIAGFKDANISLVAYTSRNIRAAPTRPGEFGYVEAKQEKLTIPAIKVKFKASEWDKNAMYQVYKSLIVEEDENEEGDNSTNAESDNNALSNILQGNEKKILPVCQDYWASKACQIMYTACGVEQFGTPLDDGGFEPKSNGTLVMKVFTGKPGEKYFVNVVVKGGNGVMTSYAGAQVFIANKPTRSAVDSDTQIMIISIVSSIFGGLALLMAFAWFKLKRAVNMKDPTKKKKKKGSGKKKESAKEELSKILKGVNPSTSSMPPSPSKRSTTTTKPKPPGPPPKPKASININNGTTQPPPGPPPTNGGMRMRASKYVVTKQKNEEEKIVLGKEDKNETQQEKVTSSPPPPPPPKETIVNAESINKTAINTSSVVKPGAGSKNPKEDREAVLVDRTS